MRRYAPDAEIHFKRVAVLDEQIERWNLPLRPNKPGDSRTKKFHRQAGSVEFDAIPARELSKLVRDSIELHVDQDLHTAEDTAGRRAEISQAMGRAFPPGPWVGSALSTHAADLAARTG